MKKIVIAAFCLILSVPAIAGTWTNWFTIDSLGYDLYNQGGSEAYFYIVPSGSVENPNSCTDTSHYVLGSTHSSHTVGDSLNKKETSKLPTLAYTAGWQIRLSIVGCQHNRPQANSIEIKKP